MKNSLFTCKKKKQFEVTKNLILIENKSKYLKSRFDEL